MEILSVYLSIFCGSLNDKIILNMEITHKTLVKV